MIDVIHGTRFAPIAVLGYGCVLPPDGHGPDLFWRNIMAGRDGISAAPPGRWRTDAFFSEDRRAEDATYCRLGGFIRDFAVTHVDGFVDVTRIAELNRTQQVALDCCLQALRHTAYADPTERRGCGLYLGNTLGDEVANEISMRDYAADILALVQASPALRGLPGEHQRRFVAEFTAAVATAYPSRSTVAPCDYAQSGLAPAVASVLGLAGPAVLVDGACASGLLVVDVAVRALQERAVPAVLAVGVMANMGISVNVSFSKIGSLSPDGSRPLDADANGLILSEGGGAVLLKRLDDAMGDGDPIVGVIRGTATKSDGKGRAIYTPSNRGQIAAMRRVLERAGVSGHDIDHVEANATGTPSGDDVEIQSILEVIGPAKPDGRRVSIGSVKSLIGHSFAAAGLANLVKVLLCLDHGVIAPTHRITSPHPLLDENRDRVVVHTSATAWPDTLGRPRRALANAFGFGGLNSSICMEAYDERYHRAVLAEGSRQCPPDRPQALAVLGMGIVEPPERDTRSVIVRCADGDSAGGDLNFPWRQIRIPPVVLPDVDRAHQMALMAASAALKQAGVGAGEDVGVFVGAATGLEIGLERNLRIRLVEFVELIEGLPIAPELDRRTLDGIHACYLGPVRAGIRPTGEDALPGCMDSVVAGRISNMFDLRGASMVVDTDVSSFLTAVDLAWCYLGQGEQHVALVGAVSANRSPLLAEALLPAPGASVDAAAHEVAVMFVVKPVQDVQPEDQVLGVITGCEPIRDEHRRFPVVGPEDRACLGASAARWLWRHLTEGRSGSVFVERALRPGTGYAFSCSCSVVGQPGGTTTVSAA